MARLMQHFPGLSIGDYEAMTWERRQAFLDVYEHDLARTKEARG